MNETYSANWEQELFERDYRTNFEELNQMVDSRVVEIKAFPWHRIDFDSAFAFLTEKYRKYRYVCILDKLIGLVDGKDTNEFPQKYYYLAKYLKLCISGSYKMNTVTGLFLKYDNYEFRKYFSDKETYELLDTMLNDKSTCYTNYRKLFFWKHGFYQNTEDQLFDKLEIIRNFIEQEDYDSACSLYLKANREQQLFLLDAPTRYDGKPCEIVRDFTESFPNQNYLEFFKVLYDKHKVPEAIEHLFVWSSNSWFGSYYRSVYQNTPYAAREILSKNNNIDWLVDDIYISQDPDVLDMVVDDISRDFGCIILERAQHPESREIAQLLIEGEYDLEKLYRRKGWDLPPEYA